MVHGVKSDVLNIQEFFDNTAAQDPADEGKGQTFGAKESQDMKSIIKSALVEALKDQEAAKHLSEEIASGIFKFNADETEAVVVNDNMCMTGEDFISCIPSFNPIITRGGLVPSFSETG